MRTRSRTRTGHPGRSTARGLATAVAAALLLLTGCTSAAPGGDRASGAAPAPSGGPAGQPGSYDGPRPQDQNLLAWTGDPNDAGHVTAQSAAGVGGRVTLVRIVLRQEITWSNIWMGLAGIDPNASLSHCYLGVYDATGTLRGATADISPQLMTEPIAKPFALTKPFTAAPGTYYVALLLNGNWTTNLLTLKSTGAGISVNAGLTPPNLRYSTVLTGQTSLPPSVNLAEQSTATINTGWASQWYGVS
ncbi:hypothetical protein [Streptomyces antimicrobicus]|uniref:Lipoprotein n=1 Tax=Streptomyces antimicrobicus TaxID=2883108 RepID=A0ABS8BA27_9ACTN|nr:hypothetical protein [Streptomyces antimicrobicus]MCB5181483.1 hypothetical protein [Streptomyces antimicrobicus]